MEWISKIRLAPGRSLGAGIVLAAVFALAACTGDGTTTAGATPVSGAQTQAAAVTPTSTSQAEAASEQAPSQDETVARAAPPVDCSNLVVTPEQTEGPYYKAGSPERSSLLEPGMTGTRLVITGYVLDTNCRPIAGAWLDFWQANDAGQYDNSGYTLRGHLYTDANGRYELETIVPGLYPGRTRHIHVKAQAPGGPVLTSQLYLPDEPQNARDGIFRPQAVMSVQDNPNGNGLLATYNFVLNLG